MASFPAYRTGRLAMTISFYPSLRSLFLPKFRVKHNLPLTKYLIQQVAQSNEDRLKALQEFVPTAKLEDWMLETAGQRVQVIKQDEEEGGILEFRTEVVSTADGSLAALLGASPGGSTAVSIMITVLQKCFAMQMKTGEWKRGSYQMIPSFDVSLAKDEVLLHKVRQHTTEVLKL